jgi:biotin carboxyl carrier protein
MVDDRSGRAGRSVAAVTGRDRAIDPRAIRVAASSASGRVEAPPILIEPPAIPLAPAPRRAGLGILGGVAAPPTGDVGSPAGRADGYVLVDGRPVEASLDGPDERGRAVLSVHDEVGRWRWAVLLLDPPDGRAESADGVIRRDVVIDGWRIDVEIESERRAALRERASRGRQAVVRGGPTEVRAIIPGRVLSVSVVAGDDVVAGQQLLAVEAMKMQNELRAPRDGRIERVAVAADQTIEVGDLLLVIE